MVPFSRVAGGSGWAYGGRGKGFPYSAFRCDHKVASFLLKKTTCSRFCLGNRSAILGVWGAGKSFDVESAFKCYPRSAFVGRGVSWVLFKVPLN